MGTVWIRARLEPGYAALERVLRDLEKLDLHLQLLRVATYQDLMEFHAQVGGTPQCVANLAARLERHVGVLCAITAEAGPLSQEGCGA